MRYLAGNRYFWTGLGFLAAFLVVIYLLVNYLVMPAVTRHEVAVQVPAVTDMAYEEAVRVLENADLKVERMEERFDPNRERGVVLDQNPAAELSVKPGRRIYLTVNSGDVPMVTVPSVLEVSLREAKARLQGRGLVVAAERPDSIPSPHRNTVTRQEPRPGASVPKGSDVTLWYSTGLGESYVTVPDVTGQTVEAAREMLLNRNLRAVIVGRVEDYEGLGEPTVQRQSREPGTRVREGFEVRLFLEAEEDEEQ